MKHSATDLDPRVILRTIESAISELGTFSTALILQDTVSKITGDSEAFDLAETLSETFPMYGELIATGNDPDDIKNFIKENTKYLAETLKGFTSIVVVGIEAVILDQLARHLPDSIIYIVPHTGNMDAERVLSNFPANVRLIDLRDLMPLGGVRSVLISYIFCPMGDDSFVYPVTFRAVGPDIRSAYNQIIGLNMLSGYQRYLSDMAPLYSTSRFFTTQFRMV
ncbi:hypothetical protein MTBBW1_80138 [Desulfamplus magnetovallimortis]|uniref:Uncharacterized protein n=1 Tax=Desulfamplus magnetovallimortis TaxID=1246637 RepID=L0R4F3_9BACT|nr:hypothetical protein [Desulfamplus magnetovallimortis]CCO06744.1 hypothetical protein DEMABW1_80138 [Desulfamplus magnetovallimortis BW-1]SLM32795.1 hypothetical protein MTBBW1_80138 [Desulfamplus magnetovallimortis]